MLGPVQAGHLVGGHRREPAVDRPLDDAVHVTAREQIGGPDPIGGERRPAKGHVLVADLEDGVQVAPHRAFPDHDAHAEAEPLERFPGRDRLVAGVQPGRGAGDEPRPPRPRRVAIHRLAERPGALDQRQEPLGLRQEPVPVDLAQTEHTGVFEESLDGRGVEQRLTRARLRREVGDHRRGGVGVDRLDAEGVEEPPRAGHAERGRDLDHLRDQRGEAPRDRFPQEGRQRDEDVEVRVAVEEARHEHLAADVEPLGRRARQGREVRADRRDAPVRHGHVPANDLAGIDVDHVAAGGEQVGGGRAERDSEEAPPDLGPRHVAAPGGVTRSDQPRRAAQVRRNSAYERTW